MKVTVNGKVAGSKESGCALCGATWGNYYDVICGERLFFCCDLCAKGFKNIVDRSGIENINSIEIKGNYYSGRRCVVSGEGRASSFFIRFNDDAEVSEFREEQFPRKQGHGQSP
ncbi:MAG: TA0938 family protein [Conexivisphaerales archaeon]